MDALTTTTTLPEDRLARLYASFFGGLSPSTIRARKEDLRHFARWLKLPTAEEAGKHLISQAPGDANLLALDYRNWQRENDIPSASINRRLSTLRQVVEFAATLGLIPWALRVKSVPHKSYRDTSGPPVDDIRQSLWVLDQVAQDETDEVRKLAKRNRALVWLLAAPGLRLFEVRNITTADVDLEKSRVKVRRKGRSDSEWLTIPAQTRAAVASWTEENPGYTGPLFFRMDEFAPEAPADRTPLCPTSIRKILRELGLGRPHGLRHAFVTAGLHLTNGNVRAVQKAAGHADVKVTMVYDDNRQDVAGKVSQIVADFFAQSPFPPDQNK
jgi:integrase